MSVKALSSKRAKGKTTAELDEEYNALLHAHEECAISFVPNYALFLFRFPTWAHSHVGPVPLRLT